MNAIKPHDLITPRLQGIANSILADLQTGNYTLSQVVKRTPGANARTTTDWIHRFNWPRPKAAAPVKSITSTQRWSLPHPPSARRMWVKGAPILEIARTYLRSISPKGRWVTIVEWAERGGWGPHGKNTQIQARNQTTRFFNGPKCWTARPDDVTDDDWGYRKWELGLMGIHGDEAVRIMCKEFDAPLHKSDYSQIPPEKLAAMLFECPERIYPMEDIAEICGATMKEIKEWTANCTAPGPREPVA